MDCQPLSAGCSLQAPEMPEIESVLSETSKTTFESDFAGNQQALIEYTERQLRRLFENDSLLRDLPFDVTAEEVSAQVSRIRSLLPIILPLAFDEY